MCVALVSPAGSTGAVRLGKGETSVGVKPSLSSWNRADRSAKDGNGLLSNQAESFLRFDFPPRDFP